MPRFRVTFERIITSTITLIIPADDKQEAHEKGKRIINEPYSHWELEAIKIWLTNVEKE